MIALVLLALLREAAAGSIYINGVRADEPPAVTLQGVTVRIDAAGDIFIDAPRYNVQVVSGSTLPAALSPAAPSPAALSPAAPSPYARASPLTWYLVSEDQASVGGIVDVYVNGAFVRRIESGQSQLLVDLSTFVQPGVNAVKFVPMSAASQGELGAYVGGANSAGPALRIDAPAVTWRASLGRNPQEYTFVVP